MKWFRATAWWKSPLSRAFQPDLLLAVGGGSVLDGTQFIALAAGLDPWDIAARQEFSGTPLPVAWNCASVISRRSVGQKCGQHFPDCAFPKFSLIDPPCTLTLPVRQLRNGVDDAITHCLDNSLTPVSVPLLEQCCMPVVKELVPIDPNVVKEGSLLELHKWLIMAASFALNGLFQLGKPGYAGIHKLGHQLTAKYGIDHGSTLAICTKGCLESQFEARKAWFAAFAEFVFRVHDGTVEQRARVHRRAPEVHRSAWAANEGLQLARGRRGAGSCRGAHAGDPYDRGGHPPNFNGGCRLDPFERAVCCFPRSTHRLGSIAMRVRQSPFFFCMRL
jgi:alcohol dehydrogenase YqhD (iron-dependent ADH family)